MATARRRWAIGWFVLLTAGGTSCREAPTRALPAPPAWEIDNPIRPPVAAPYGLEFYFAHGEQQPPPARVRLGRWLFYDRRLSADNTVACATCHRPEYAFSEPRPAPAGMHGAVGTRKTPSFINQAVTLTPHFFWDGRAHSLEEQALMPVENPAEMGNTRAGMIRALAGIAGYRPYFIEAFGTAAITADRVAGALAAYERTRVSGGSSYDRSEYHHETAALSKEARAGRNLFFFKAGCVGCHLGSNFTDGKFHNLGVGWDPVAKTFRDTGRAAVTHDPLDVGAFKTPGLRDVSKRAPYMHDGSLPTLRAVVEFYNRGGNDNPHRRPGARPLGLTEREVSALGAFLRSLDGEGYQDIPPGHFPQ